MGIVRVAVTATRADACTDRPDRMVTDCSHGPFIRIDMAYIVMAYIAIAFWWLIDHLTLGRLFADSATDQCTDRRPRPLTSTMTAISPPMTTTKFRRGPRRPSKCL